MNRIFITLIFCFLNSICLAQTLDSLKSMLKSSKTDTNQVAILNEISFLSWDIAPNEGVKYAKSALLLSQKLKYSKGIYQSYSRIGVNYWALGKLALAFDALNKSIAEAQKTNAVEAISNAEFNIALIYSAMHNHGKAIEIFKKIAQRERLKKNDTELSITYNDLSNTYSKIGELDSALYYATASLKLLDSEENDPTIIYRYLSLGEIHGNKRELNKALNYAKKALLLSIKNKNVTGLINSYQLLGEFELINKNYSKAKLYLDSCLTLAQKYEMFKTIAPLNKSLSRIDSAEGKFKAAYFHFLNYAAIQDSLVNFQQRKELSDLYIQHETLEKEKENDILRKDKLLKEQALIISEEKHLLSKTIMISVTIVLLFATITLVLLYLGYQSKIKAFNELTMLNAENLTQKMKLAQANEEIKAINENLEELVRQRTEKIEVQKEKIVEFAFYNAHKVRGPLARILGLLVVNKMDTNLSKEEIFEKLEASAKEMDLVLSEINKIVEE